MAGSLKAINRIMAYKKHSRRQQLSRLELRGRYLAGLKDKSHYNKHRAAILIFSMLFYAACVLARVVFNVPGAVYLSGVFLLLALEGLFVAGSCVLNGIVNILFKTPLRCCNTCPVKGWDMVLIMLPCVFMLRETTWVNVVCILAVLTLSTTSLIFWEAVKFGVMSTSENCGLCKKKCFDV